MKYSCCSWINIKKDLCCSLSPSQRYISSLCLYSIFKQLNICIFKPTTLTSGCISSCLMAYCLMAFDYLSYGVYAFTVSYRKEVYLFFYLFILENIVILGILFIYCFVLLYLGWLLAASSYKQGISQRMLLFGIELFSLYWMKNRHYY